MEQLKTSLSVVLERAGEYFLKQSPIHRAALRIAHTFDDLWQSAQINEDY